MQELEVVYLPISALSEYERNARKHEKKDVGAIIASIREFGFLDPIGIWGEDNTIVEGHGRLLAARELDMETVPCIRLDDLTDEQRRAYALAHNLFVPQASKRRRCRGVIRSRQLCGPRGIRKRRAMS